ncbi:hypothetical protein JIG36_05435 [Actinoplanes sp. LDG1-06]|uniref:Secreted protein n=1 Tax=Paractinoplanes ovalisporus TaxID=2810368 RepID=A0ABS2A574_9ACTN|nr:hypothetical protein [Actinoplanes ovalisporus]MBM2615000.1 hypothetical protein [Actinoplanes ovalisporus]
MRIAAYGIGLLLVVGGALAGCGDGGAEPEATKTVGDTGSQWTKCLRDNGVDVKDQDPEGNPLTLPSDSPVLEAALAKCKQYEPQTSGKTGAEGSDQERVEYQLKLAKCMREKGIDWADPSGDQQFSVPEMSPETMKALDECSTKIRGAK